MNKSERNKIYNKMASQEQSLILFPIQKMHECCCDNTAKLIIKFSDSKKYGKFTIQCKCKNNIFLIIRKEFYSYENGMLRNRNVLKS
jgi:hypothetical protein